MTSLKKRLLLSLSAAALAVPMASGSAQAIEVVVLEQLNLATQSAELSFEDLWGESLSATAAAIGNSAAFNIEGVDDAATLDLEQNNVGVVVGPDGNQFADIHLDDVGLTGGIALTAAAIGNTLSGTGAGTVVDLDLDQVNGVQGKGFPPEGQLAHILLENVVIGGLESTISAAAIGNSASLTAGAIGTGDDFDSVRQINDGGQGALVEVFDLVVEATDAGAAFDVTAAALGNSLTLDAASGDLFLDTLRQVNRGDRLLDGYGPTALGQYAVVDLYSLNDVVTPTTPVGVSPPSVETFDSTVVAAAIGNSASLSADGDILLDEITQTNRVFQSAEIAISYAYGLGDLTTTAVAIGNSLSIDAGDALAFDKVGGGINQSNRWRQVPEITIAPANINGDLALTAAAIGNSLSITAGEGGFDFGDTTAIVQETENVQGQNANVLVDAVYGLEDVSGTVVAIGNSASITSGGDFSFGSYGQIEQTNLSLQNAELQLTELNGAGAVEITVAAIGNSLSIDASGELSGVGAGIMQENLSPQHGKLNLDLTQGSFASLDATTVAIGNSLSLGAGSFEGTGTLAVAQINLADQSVFLRLDDAGLGTMSATTAAIGNSASVTIR